MANDDVVEAIDRLDKLIGKARADLYKPIAVAEILFRNRVEGGLNLLNKEDYRRHSYKWMLSIISILHNKTTQLNSRYWDQTFDDSIMPPRILEILGQANRCIPGVVECYIYWHLKSKFSGLAAIKDELYKATPETFDLLHFLAMFEKDKRFKRSIDKAYEIIVYALFNAVALALEANVTLAIGEGREGVLKDFDDFAELVLGINASQPKISQPARLFRVGATNAADGGLDMWANFGPAVQVKHISLSPEETSDICNKLQADSVVVVCKKASREAIGAVMAQIGLDHKLRGIITEDDLVRWYSLGCSSKYRDTIGTYLLDAMRTEMRLEFPLTESERIDRFFEEREYDVSLLQGTWAVYE